jgi:hypothetical protein
MSRREMWSTPYMGMRVSPMIPVAGTKVVEIASVGKGCDEAGHRASTPLAAMRPKRMLLAGDKGAVAISPARCGGDRA